MLDASFMMVTVIPAAVLPPKTPTRFGTCACFGTSHSVSNRSLRYHWDSLDTIWSLASIALNIRLRLYQSTVVAAVAYESETWAMSAKCAKKLNAFQQRCLRRILRERCANHVTNNEILNRCESNSPSTLIGRRRLRLAGHAQRKPEHRFPRVVMGGFLKMVAEPAVV